MKPPITVAIDFMNRDHATFVQQLIELKTALESAPDDKIGELIDALFEHTVEHFSHEEEEMQRINFPPYPMHKGEHDRVINVLNEAITLWKKEHNRALLATFIEETVTPWFYLHIETMDSITAQFIHQFDASSAKA